MILNFFVDLFIFIITLGILIMVHEYGHFLAARFFKIKIEQVSIGFGPVLWNWKDTNGTKYVISAFLVGGYIKLFDKKTQQISSNCQFNDSFYPKYIWKRSIIVLAGPIFNFIFSILLYIIIFTVGTPIYRPIINYILPNSVIDQSKILIGSEIKFINNVQVTDWESVRLMIFNNINQKSMIITVNLVHDNKVNYKKCIVHLPYNWFNQPIIATTDPIIALGIFPNIVYVKSNIIEKECLFLDKQNDLQIGDKILLINSKPIYNWKSFMRMIEHNQSKIFNLLIERNNNLLYLNCSLYKKNYFNNTDKYKNINLFLETFMIKAEQKPETYRYGLPTAILKAFNKTWNFICFTIKMLAQLFFGDIKIANLHGPIAIAKEAGQSAHSGLIYYLMFLSIVSINLGIMNLLPFPVLDGGQLFFILLEKVKGSAISQKIQDFINIISFIILICITFLTLYNDITT